MKNDNDNYSLSTVDYLMLILFFMIGVPTVVPIIAVIIVITILCIIVFIIVFSVYLLVEFIYEKIDYYFIPHKEEVVGELIACRERKELSFYYQIIDLDNINKTSPPPLLIDRYFLIIKKESQKAIRVLVPKMIYNEMSRSKGQIINLFCKKCGVDNFYELCHK